MRAILAKVLERLSGFKTTVKHALSSQEYSMINNIFKSHFNILKKLQFY